MNEAQSILQLSEMARKAAALDWVISEMATISRNLRYGWVVELPGRTVDGRPAKYAGKDLIKTIECAIRMEKPDA